MLQPTCFGTNNICPNRFPVPNPCHYSLSVCMCVCSQVGRESMAAASQHQMGHSQEVMRGKHLLLCPTPLLHFQPFDTTYAGRTCKTKWPWREQPQAETRRNKCLTLQCISQWSVVFGISHSYTKACLTDATEQRLYVLPAPSTTVGAVLYSLHKQKRFTCGLPERHHWGQNAIVSSSSSLWTWASNLRVTSAEQKFWKMTSLFVVVQVKSQKQRQVRSSQSTSWHLTCREGFWIHNITALFFFPLWSLTWIKTHFLKSTQNSWIKNNPNCNL